MRTMRIPSLVFAGAALGCLGASVAFYAADKKHLSLFAAQLAPVALLLGLYNKVVKTFSAPVDEEARLRHGDHPVRKPNDFSIQPRYHS